MYLLKVHSVCSPYHNKIKQTSHLGKQSTLQLDILGCYLFFYGNSLSISFYFHDNVTFLSVKQMVYLYAI